MNSSRQKVELPTHEDGELVDYLEEDPELPNQRYCIVSFISPEKVIEKKNDFFFQKFIQWMDYDWKVKGLEHFAAYIAQKYSLKVDDIMKDIHEFEKTHRDEIKKTDVPAFDKANSFQCNIRGVKVRRAFPSYEEAQLWCKVLQRKYPKDNLMIGRMGCWLPWEPSEHLMENVEYANSQLNEIMRKYKENESNRELFFAEEREGAMKAQREENAKRRAEQAQLKALEAPVHPAEGGMRE
jgi:hypothetical protein